MKEYVIILDGLIYAFKRTRIFEKLAYIDSVNFVSRLNCELLVGTALLDEFSPPSTQYALFNNAKCRKEHIVFKKYGHELNNFFENENLKFLIEL